MHNLIIKVRSKLLVFLTHNMALPILRLIRSPQKFQYTKAALHDLPEGTLGKELVNMLDKKNLQLLPYYAKHDIKHILLQYDTTDEGEVCLQCFMLGNKHLSFPVVATVIYGVFTMPEYWSKFGKAYHRGAGCQPIAGWQWFTLLDQPVQSLIKKINDK
ncbi:MAG: Coq4 family protein [Ferruginibacter sp.]